MAAEMLDSLRGLSNPRSSSRKRGKRNFSYEETAMLLDIWGDDEVQRRFENAARHLILWREISERMATAGYLRDADECRNKINNLRAEYLRLKRNHQEGAENATTWPFYPKMDRVFRSKPMADSKHDASSSVLRDENSVDSTGKLDTTSPNSPQSDLPNPQQQLRERFSELTSSREKIGNGCESPPFKRPRFRCTSRPSIDMADNSLERLVELEKRSLEIMRKRVENEERMIDAAMQFFSCVASFFHANNNVANAPPREPSPAMNPSPVYQQPQPHSHHHPTASLSPPVHSSPPAWADPGF